MVIEERVEIGGLPTENKLNKGSSIIYKDDIPSGFIMPRSGMLQVFYGYLTHYDGPMPWYSSLNTYFFKDDSTRVDELTPRFTDYIYWQRNFPFCNPSTRWGWNYFPSNLPEEYLYDVDKVTEGDTIQVTYFSDWVASQDTFTYGVYSATEIWVDSQLVGWDVILGNYDWCMEEFDNALFISIGVRDLFKVWLEPEEIFPGDTAEVIIKKILFDGTLADFDTSQTFEIGKLEGCTGGDILAEGDTAAHFYNVHQPFKFVAADSIDEDSIVVKIRVGLIDSTGGDSPFRVGKNLTTNNVLYRSEDEKKMTGNLLNKKTPRDSIEIRNHVFSLWKKRKTVERDVLSFSCFPEYWWIENLNADTSVTVINDKAKILLGERKFYGVKKKTENDNVTEIKIQEIKVEQDATPVFPSLTGNWSWIQDSTVWSGRPINIETHGQSPIFYDKFYAQVYYTGTTKPVIHDLPEGMIRVIGRYLGKTPDNKVKLFTTQYQNFTDTLEIQVIRPDKLGDDILSITGPTKVDYEDSTYNNIDSLVIDIAGELGIPPQYLMGIVQKESPNGLGYRYEPFSDMITVQKKFDSNHRYWIESETELGDPPIPHHNNIKDARGPLDNYPGFITVWEIFNEKNDGSPKMYSLGVYKHIKKNYWDVFNKNWVDTLKKRGVNSNLIVDSARVLADTSYIKFLRDSIEGKGMYGTIAQTRISASYGFMQLTYFSGVTSYKKWVYNYPNNDANFLPEYIMIPPINIVYGSKHFLGKLRDNLGPVVYPDEDTWPWAQAFELSYWKAILGYNGGSEKKYPNMVFSHVKNNLPKKN